MVMLTYRWEAKQNRRGSTGSRAQVTLSLLPGCHDVNHSGLSHPLFHDRMNLETVSQNKSFVSSVVYKVHCYSTQKRENLVRWPRIQDNNFAEPSHWGCHSGHPERSSIFKFTSYRNCHGWQQNSLNPPVLQHDLGVYTPPDALKQPKSSSNHASA